MDDNGCSLMIPISYDNDQRFRFDVMVLRFFLCVRGEVLLLHQTRPSTDFVTPLAVRHLAIPTNGELTVDV